MKHKSRNLNIVLGISVMLIACASLTLTGERSLAQPPVQERPVWDVKLASGAQARSNLTIQNQCQHAHAFTIIEQQTPYLQLLAAPTVNVPGQSSYDLPVSFNTSGMRAGEYQGTVVVKCEDCRKEKTCQQDREIIPVHLTVLQENAPQMMPENPTQPKVPGPPIIAQEAPPKPGPQGPLREGQTGSRETVSTTTGALEQEKGKDGKTSTVELRCYDFVITNRGNKTITDLHFVFSGGKPVFPHAPDGWGGQTSESGDLIFRTPPRTTPPAPGRTRERETPKGVKPKGKQGGFRFYLTGKAKTDTIYFSYDDGTISPALPTVEVAEGGETVTEIESGDPKAQIRRTTTIYCSDVILTAPKDYDVSDIHLTGVMEVTPPENWHIASVDEKTGTINLERDYRDSKGNLVPPLGKGKTMKFKIYSKLQNPVKWKLTDAEHNDIPGASGEVYIK